MTSKGSNLGRTIMTCLAAIAILVLLVVAVDFLLIGNKHRRDTREAEVKQNLHAIQLAVERYAVDNEGRYPFWLSGGCELRREIRQMDTSVWVEGGKRVDEVDFDPGQPSPDVLADPLMAEGYMPCYPANPFARTGRAKNETRRAVREMQELLLDPLQPVEAGDMPAPAYRFGKDYDLMGNVLADPRFAEVLAGVDSDGNPNGIADGVVILLSSFPEEVISERSLTTGNDSEMSEGDAIEAAASD